jgi:pyruvate/2-oxoglutarate dehydrogenase complex dihydrolipoamide acyltransferase (E2) component
MSKMTTRRKLAIASWSAPKEGNIYGKLTIDASNAEAYLEELRKRSGEKVTITHLVGKACALALQEEPSLNGRISFGRFIQHETVDISFLVATEGGKDLAKAKVVRAEQKSLVEIARELREGAARLRNGKDEAFEKSKGPLKLLPTWAIKPMVSLTGYLTGSLGINMKGLGLEALPFGSCIITSVGMLGVDEGFAPPTPWAHVPVYVMVGAIKEQPAVVDGQIVPRPLLTLTATIDHRFVDGFQLGTLAKVIRQIFEDPWSLDKK